MAEPTSSAVIVWSAVGGLAVTILGPNAQAIVTVALIGAAWALVTGDAPGPGWLARLAVIASAILSVALSAISAVALGQFFALHPLVVNGLTLGFAVGGPLIWKKVPSWFDLLIQRITR